MRAVVDAQSSRMRLVDVPPDALLEPGVYRLYITPTSTAGRAFLRLLPTWAWRIATEWGNQPENGRLVFLGYSWDEAAGAFIVRVQVLADAALTEQAAGELSTAAAPVLVAITATAIAAGLFALWGLAATLTRVVREVVADPAGRQVAALVLGGVAAVLLLRRRAVAT